MRWQRMSALADDCGWDVEVLTLDPAQVERRDPRRLEELPRSLRVHHVARRLPFLDRAENAVWGAWRRLRPARSVPVAGGPTVPGVPAAASAPGSFGRDEIRWTLGGRRALLRAWAAWRAYAKERAWALDAVEAGLRAAQERRPDAVLSCGPPHLVHEAGRRLAEVLGLPFVIDMRDPWSLQQRLQEDMATPLWFRLAERAERRCVRRAQLVVMNTPKAAERMQRAYPAATVISAMNGWDPEAVPEAPWPAQFRIVFAGAIYLDRSPQPLFRALARAVRRLGLAPADLEVRLIGLADESARAPVAAMAAAEGVGDFVRLLPPAPRREVLREYAEAAVLLSLPQDSDMAIPSKVFEYAQYPAWTLAQAERDSATGMALEGTGAYTIPPEDVDSTAAMLVECYEAFRAGRRPAPIARSGRLGRRGEAAKVFAALDRLAARAR